jgi:hypothetical protein
MMKIIGDKETIPWLFHTGIGGASCGDLSLGNTNIDFMFISRSINNFSFSLNFIMNLDMETPNKEDNGLGFLANAGFIWRNRFGVLGAYIGTIARRQEFRRYDEEYDFYLLPEREYKYDLTYCIIPDLNLGNYPMVGIVFKTLGGYINIAESSVKGYSGKLVTKGFDIGPLNVLSMDYYYKKQPYNPIVSHEVFGASIGFGNFLGLFGYKSKLGFDNALHIEGGYKQYYDFIEFETLGDSRIGKKAYLQSLYTDSLFFKFTISWFEPRDKDSVIALSASWDKNYLFLPKIGFIFRLGLYSALDLDMLEGSVLSLSFEYGNRFHNDEELKKDHKSGVSDITFGVWYMLRL